MDGQRASIRRGLKRAVGLPLLILVCLVNLFLLCLRYPDVRSRTCAWTCRLGTF